MRRIERIIIAVFILVSIVLFLASSTDLLIRDYSFHNKVSIIVDDMGSENWVNGKKGMEFAAKLFDIEINYIPLWKEATAKDQMYYIRQEIENGAKVIVLAPIDTEELMNYIQKEDIKIPILTLNEYMDIQNAFSVFCADYPQLFIDLKNTILSDTSGEKKKVYLVENEKFTRRLKEKDEKLSKVLNSAGLHCETIDWKSEAEVEKIEKKDAVYIGMEPMSTELLGKLAEEGTMKKAALYGLGWNQKIAHYLEERVFRTIVVVNEYDQGYLSVVLASMHINGEKIYDWVPIRYDLVTPDDMYESEYEKMLFPIS